MIRSRKQLAAIFASMGKAGKGREAARLRKNLESKIGKHTAKIVSSSSKIFGWKAKTTSGKDKGIVLTNPNFKDSPNYVTYKHQLGMENIKSIMEKGMDYRKSIFGGSEMLKGNWFYKGDIDRDDREDGGVILVVRLPKGLLKSFPTGETTTQPIDRKHIKEIHIYPVTSEMMDFTTPSELFNAVGEYQFKNLSLKYRKKKGVLASMKAKP